MRENPKRAEREIYTGWGRERERGKKKDETGEKYKIEEESRVWRKTRWTRTQRNDRSEGLKSECEWEWEGEGERACEQLPVCFLFVSYLLFTQFALLGWFYYKPLPSGGAAAASETRREEKRRDEKRNETKWNEIENAIVLHMSWAFNGAENVT